MKKNNKKSKVFVDKMVTVGAGVAALGAGAYYLLGPNAKAHQKKAKNLMTKMNKGAIKLKSEWKDVPKFAKKTTQKAVKTLKNKRA